MSRSTHKTTRIPYSLWDSFEALCEPGQPLAEYPSRNAAIVGVLRYMAIFPIPHRLTAAIARMDEDHQDLIDDFILMAIREEIDLREQLPKPATAEALLALAQRWKKTTSP